MLLSCDDYIAYALCGFAIFVMNCNAFGINSLSKQNIACNVLMIDYKD